mgnify:FL=1
MSIIDSFDFLEKDERVRKYILPEKIAGLGGNVKNPEALLKAKTLQIGLNETDVTELFNDGDGQNAFVVLDFGKELHGGIRLLNFVSEITAYPKVRLTFGESLCEAMSQIGQKGACNDHAVRDFEIPVSSYSDQEWGQTGFRFVKIELTEPKAKIAIKAAPAVFIYRELEYKGRFCCDDEDINRIFDTAAYTCHLNLQNMVWDGIKRDRLVWIGDMHPEMLTARTVFGPLGIINKSLEFARSQAPLPLYMNGMASYSMWWLIIAWDYYFYSGDSSLLTGQKEYVLSLLRLFCGKVNDDGSDSVGNYFLDWPTHQKELSEKSGVRALLKIALEKGALISEFLNDGRLCEICRNKAEKISKIPGDHEGQKQTAAFMSAAGLMKKEQAAEVIKKNGSDGISAYLLFYTLKELADTDEISALNILKNYSLGMLQRGATTFWEDYDPLWAKNTGSITDLPKDGQDDIHGDRGDYCYKGFRHSLCHGWASGAVPFLMEQVAGIHIVGAGCRKIEIKPKMGNLKFIKASYPTPYGVLELSIENKNGRPKISFSAPDGVEIII